MSEFRADLHCHSRFSDGDDSPKELIDQALAIGLQGLSITDHDTLLAYKEAIPYAKQVGLSLLVGIELSAVYERHQVHILGYGFELTQELIEFCADHMERRKKRFYGMLEKLERHGVVVQCGEIIDQPISLGRRHLARCMVLQGLVQSMQDAFEKYLGEGKIGYEEGGKVSVAETIESLHRAGGKAIIAHPCFLKDRVLRDLERFPFDGIEGYYGSLPLSQEKKYLSLAKKHHWIVTGGSDYHGKTHRLENLLGSSWVDDATFRTLYGT